MIKRGSTSTGFKRTLQQAKGAMGRLYGGAMKVVNQFFRSKDKETFNATWLLSQTTGWIWKTDPLIELLESTP